jgi:hypothetical protein
MEVKIDAAI